MAITEIDWSGLINTVYSIVTCIGVVIGTVGTAFGITKSKSADKAEQKATEQENLATKLQGVIKTFNDLMKPNNEQTQEQTDLAKTDIVDKDTWTMDIQTKDEVYKQLVEAGGVVTRDGVYAGIAQMEAAYNMDYVIRCHDYQKGSIMDDPAAFISFGQIVKVADWETVKQIAYQRKCGNVISVS